VIHGTLRSTVSLDVELPITNALTNCSSFEGVLKFAIFASQLAQHNVVGCLLV